MIVNKMSYSEINKEIFIDLENVYNKLTYLMRGIDRKINKSKNKYYKEVIEYTSTRKNKWLIFVEGFKKKYFIKTVILFDSGYGVNAICNNCDNSLIHLTTHYLSRYKERFLKQENITVNDLIIQYFWENSNNVLDILPDYLKNEDTSTFCVTKNGIGLGCVEKINAQTIYHFKTFITQEMLYEEQYTKYKILIEQYKYYVNKRYAFKLKNVA